MHWYCYNDAARLLNEAKCRIYLSLVNSKIFEIHLNFVCQLAISQPAVALSVGL